MMYMCIRISVYIEMLRKARLGVKNQAVEVLGG